MKITSAAALMALALWLTGVSAGYAQSPTQPTPTTRILAIGTINQGADLAAARAILPTEVRETVKLYLDGKIDQWYSLQNRVGVAFILNVTDVAAAHEMPEKLPLGQAHLMTFELIPLGPLNPLRELQGRRRAGVDALGVRDASPQCHSVCSDNSLCKQQGELARPAHRVISLLRSNSVAFRAKRKSAELRFLTGL